jgi:hypothetical protein
MLLEKINQGFSCPLSVAKSSQQAYILEANECLNAAANHYLLHRCGAVGFKRNSQPVGDNRQHDTKNPKSGSAVN